MDICVRSRNWWKRQGGFQDVGNNICTKKSDTVRKECKACLSALVNPITTKLDYQRGKMKYRTSQKWDITDRVCPELLPSVWNAKRFCTSWQQKEFICNLSLTASSLSYQPEEQSCFVTICLNNPNSAPVVRMSKRWKMQPHWGMRKDPNPGAESSWVHTPLYLAPVPTF